MVFRLSKYAHLGALVVWVCAVPVAVAAHDMAGMEMDDSPSSSASPPAAQAPKEKDVADDFAAWLGVDDFGGMGMMHEADGILGPYTMTREASGTSWQPDSTPYQGVHFPAGHWGMMAEGSVTGVFDDQGGKRGADKTFASGQAMLMASRHLTENGVLGLRAMMSLDPFMGSNGYPLLFATGETANGRESLVDRQHPHDLFMELAGTYSYKLSPNSSVFAYAGLPGEPALGPTAFMHRFSGMDNPEAPIAHHWLDSTHIAFGVVTAGYIYDRWKIEASSFKGREPDQHRYDIEQPKLDSFSTRLTYNPTDNWSLQASWGHLHSPEQLMPGVNENRVTVSGTYNKPFDDENNWATTFAWGRKMNDQGHGLDGFLLESSVVLHDTHTFFARAERVDEDELFEGVPVLDGRTFTVSKASLGYIRDFHLSPHFKLGLGGLVSRYLYSANLDSVYGQDPTSFMLFMRLKLE